MKLAVYILRKETKELKSVKVYDKEKKDLEDAVKNYNETNVETEAIIIDDKLTVEALDLKESTDSIKSAFDKLINLTDELNSTRNEINTMFDNLSYMMNNIENRIENLVKEESQKHT